ncbi:hypothetical protein Dimus_039608 [Dionaea muscipula]
MATTALRLRQSLCFSSTLRYHSTASSSSSSTTVTTTGTSFLLHSPTSPLPPPQKPTILTRFPSSLSRFIYPYHSIRHRYFHSTPPSLASLNLGEEPDPDAGLDEEFGCNDWLITVKFPDDPRPSSEDMVETYLQILAKVVGSVEEAKKRMYYYGTASYTAFYAKIDEETSKKLKGMPGVVSVLPNSYSFQVKKEDEGLTQIVQDRSGSGQLPKNNGTGQEANDVSNSGTVLRSEEDCEQKSGSELLEMKQDVEIKQKRGSELLQVKQDVEIELKSADMATSEEAIDILDEDVSDEVRFWKTSLIGYVLGEQVSYGAMVRYVERKWNNVTPPQIMPHEKGVFIFRFEREEDKRAILKTRSRFFHSKLLILRPWNPDLDINKVCIDQFPTWVRFPDLKLHFWGDKVLNKLASKIGVPICIDRLTAEKKILSFARVLVDLDLSKDPVKEITLKCPNGQIVQQKVVYEKLPHRCANCNVWVLVEHKCEVVQKVEKPGFSKA